MPSKRLRVVLTFRHEDNHQVEQRGGPVVAAPANREGDPSCAQVEGRHLL
jgi:hypothetical protein